MKKLNELEKSKLIAICELYCCKDRILLIKGYDFSRSIKVSKYKEIIKKLASENTELTQENKILLTFAIVWLLNDVKLDKNTTEFYSKLKLKIQELA